MINTINDWIIPISIPITANERQRIDSLTQQLSTHKLKEQVYRNALAALVTHRYLQLLEVASDFEASVSWNPASHDPGNIAELYISQKDKHLECRSIHRGDTKCFIPKEVWGDRLGYVVVQLDEPYLEGIVLGFVPQVSVTELLLSYLQPLDALIDRLIPEPTPIWPRLSQWLKGIFEPDWEPLEHLLRPVRQPIFRFASSLTGQSRSHSEDIQQLVERLYFKEASSNLAQSVAPPTHLEPKEALVQLIQSTKNDDIRWDAAELLWGIEPRHPACPVIGTRDLGIYLGGQTVALKVGALPKSDGRVLILLRVYPFDKELYLPSGLKLAILDATGNVYGKEAASRQQDDHIQIKFTADVGDHFGVRVMLNDSDTPFTESFVV